MSKFLCLLFIIQISCMGSPYANNFDKKLTQIRRGIRNIENSLCPKKFVITEKESVIQRINCAYEVDQFIRKELIQDINVPKIQKFIKIINHQNTTILKEILSAYGGWLTITEFGKVVDHQAWILTQHADDDLCFQTATAFLLEQLSKINQTDRKNFAYLYDRVALKYSSLGLKQKYGTQVLIKNKEITIEPFYGTIEEVNKRRYEIGLESIEEYIQSMKNILYD